MTLSVSVLNVTYVILQFCNTIYKLKSSYLLFSIYTPVINYYFQKTLETNNKSLNNFEVNCLDAFWVYGKGFLNIKKIL